MKTKIIFLMFFSLLFLSSCMNQGSGQVANTAPTSNKPDETQSPGQEPEISLISSSPYSEDAAVEAYSKAYYEIVADIINKYGLYSENDKYGLMGFIRGDLIDFDQDGIPELVCIYRKEYYHTISIYSYMDNKESMLIDELAGNSILGDNWSDIRFTYINSKPYVLVQNCDWGKTEIINIYTIDNGALQTIKLDAEAQISDDPVPHVEHYLNCRINDNSVSEDDYLSTKETYYQDSTRWDQTIENNDYRSYEKDDAVEFIKSLSTDAGIGEDEVSDLLAGKE